MINKHQLATRIFAVCVHGFLELLYRSCRLSISNLKAVENRVTDGKNIFAFWHGRMLYPIYYYMRTIRTAKAAILISQSKDGDYGEALVKQLNGACIRGSSSRGGLKALHDLSNLLAEDYNLALTPDGPRGPAFRAQVGILKLAQYSHATIIPTTYNASRKITLKSWDGFIIPLPFSKVHLAFGDPITVPLESNKKEIEAFRQSLEEVLLGLDRECEEALGL
ncbi:MAG: lysophospholipid acyltransferase family protein [Phycisphaeraceae bacterium]|nr:lysophospholipid acyltransferase family protein [Phycisphaeraceae bacterium]